MGRAVSPVWREPRGGVGPRALDLEPQVWCRLHLVTEGRASGCPLHDRREARPEPAWGGLMLFPSERSTGARLNDEAVSSQMLRSRQSL